MVFRKVLFYYKHLEIAKIVSFVKNIYYKIIIILTYLAHLSEIKKL